MRRSKYTAELLAPIVASSDSLAEVMRKLGLKPTGGNHRNIAARVRFAKLDTSHFLPTNSSRSSSRVRIDELSRDLLEMLVRDCTSFRAVLVRLEMPTVGRPSQELKRRLRELEVDTSHFTGPGWSRGHTSATHPSIESAARKNRFRDEIVFVENGPPLHGTSLVRRLLAKGWSYRCAICGIVEWCERRLVLHLDHINGISNDNRLENLRLLCPNCHSQTDTYSNKAREETACYMSRHASVEEWQTQGS